MGQVLVGENDPDFDSGKFEKVEMLNPAESTPVVIKKPRHPRCRRRMPSPQHRPASRRRHNLEHGLKTMKPNITYVFHHTGIPTTEIKPNETYSASAKMFTSDNDGNFKIQWHRFEADSSLHPLIKTLPHVAFRVNNLSAAIEGEEVILGPYEPIDDYFVAMISDNGVPVEFIQTQLTDDELWNRRKKLEGALYRPLEDD